MLLERLSIDRIKYGANKDNYEGTLEFVGEYGKITINLSNDLSRSIFAVVSNDVVRAAKEIGNKLTADCIDSNKQLENKEI